MTSAYRTPSDIQPSLTYDDANAAIEWLCRVFGFTKRLVVAGPDESVMHSELSLGSGVVMVSSPRPDMKRFGPHSQDGAVCNLCVCVDDPDGHHAKSVAAGAHIIRPLQDEEYGARGYGVEDLEGHQWYFSNYRPGAYWDSANSITRRR